MLYIEISSDVFEPWDGSPIGAVRYPGVIEDAWTDQQLAALDLYRPASADPIPEGKRSNGVSVQRVDGVVSYVHDLVDIDPPTDVEINAERDRRISIGSVFPVTAYGDVPLTGRFQDQVSLMGLLIKAQGAHALGISAPVITLRDALNVNHLLTPLQTIELVQAGTAWIELVMKTSWDMKDEVGDFSGGVPIDFRSDEYWPT